jgi:phosphonate transport system permease protein
MSTVHTKAQEALRARYPQHFQAMYRGRIPAFLLALLAALVFAFGVHSLDMSYGRIVGGLGELGSMVLRMFPPDPGSWHRTGIYTYAMLETLAIALLGTLMAAIAAFPLGFLAARNTTINGVVQFFARRSFDTLRGVDILIWALIWINVVGLGPFAGVLALFMSDLGSFGKLFSEVAENADLKPVEGLTSVGATWFQKMWLGVIPQVAPNWLSYALLRFEINVREASVMGFVGAGGIGQELVVAIRKFYYSDVSAILVTIIVTVFIIDISTGGLRGRLFGKETRR